MKRRFLHAILITSAALFMAGCFLNGSSYREDDGSLVFVGEVLNQGEPLSGSRVEATLYDANGGVIATTEDFTCRVMPTNSVSAYKVTFPAGTPDPARVELRLNGNPVDDAYLASGLSARLFGTGPAQLSQGKATVYGEMRNDSGNRYQNGYACVAWKNAQGQVLRVAEGIAAGLAFDPGDVLPFAVSEDVPAGATTVEFYLDAGVTPPPAVRPDITTLPAGAFRNTTILAGPRPLGGDGTLFAGIGEVHNNTSDMLGIQVSAVTRNAAGEPNGVSDSSGFCQVPAEPGGFTYSSYIMISAGGQTAPLTVTIEGMDLSASDVDVLPVSGISLTSTSTAERVRGTVRNDSDTALNFVATCAAVYDDNGDVIGAFPGLAELPAGGLRPGATVAVSVDVPVIGDNPTRANLIAAGRP